MRFNYEPGLTGCFQHLESIGPTTSYEIQVEAVKDLINRLIPARANEFSIQIYGGQSDYFEVQISTSYHGIPCLIIPHLD